METGTAKAAEVRMVAVAVTAKARWCRTKEMVFTRVPEVQGPSSRMVSAVELNSTAGSDMLTTLPGKRDVGGKLVGSGWPPRQMAKRSA
ncbi:hypothetical protein GCM10009638_06260 [Luteococcus sanguinis]